MDYFLKRLALEREDVQEDLIGFEFSTPICKMGDFGRGWGYTTLCLMLELQTLECIGIDTFIKDDNYGVPSISDVENGFQELKHFISSANEMSENGDLGLEIRKLFDGRRFPNFQPGNMITGDNLPSNFFDFIYCKQAMRNIFDGKYNENLSNGQEGVKLAIENIANATKLGGAVCLVEPAGIDFIPFLDNSGLTFVRACRILRGEIASNHRISTHKSPFITYLYKKL